MTRKDRPLKHELEPILGHKIRDKLEANTSVSEVTELIARAHELIKRAIEVISR